MVKKIFSKISELIFGPKVVDLPPPEPDTFHISEEHLRNIERKVGKKARQIEYALAEYQAKIKKLEKELKKHKEIEDKEKKRFIESKLISMLQYYQSEKSLKTTRFIFRPPWNVKIICNDGIPFVGSGKFAGVPFPFLAGIELEQTDYGPFIHLILARKPKPKLIKKKKQVTGEYIAKLPLGYFYDLEELIEDFNNLPTNLKTTGKIKIRLSKEGKALPRFIRIPEKPDILKISDDLKKMVHVDLLRLEREGQLTKTAMNIIIGLYYEINRLRNKLSQAEKQYREALIEKLDSKLTAQSMSSANEKAQVMLANALEKNDKIMEHLMFLKSKEQETELRALLSEMLTRRLLAKIDEWAERTSGKITEEEKERIKSEFKDDIQDFMGITEKHLNLLLSKPQETKEVKKVETKGSQATAQTG